MANQIRFPFRTNFTIQLQAKYPETNAAINPAITGLKSIAPNSPLAKSRNAAPKMGIITIRNENLATSSRCLPSISPVEIVEPERLRPGSTAMAWAIPIINETR